MSKCNILCSGSRRTLFTKNNLPSIGCNIPYTEVDYIFILEYDVIDYYCNNLEKIGNSKIILREDSLHYAKNKPIMNYIESVVSSINSDRLTKFRSSGHYAAMYMIYKGFLELNIYGCDTWFDPENHLNSYTDNFVSKPENLNPNNGYIWKQQWEKMITEYKKIKFNFI